MIKRFLSRFHSKDATAARAETAALEAELQGARMQLSESEQRAARLNALLDAQRAGEAQAASAEAERQLQALMRSVATPAAQLLMQAHLFFEQGKPVQTGDVLTLAKRLVAVLEEAGLTFEGKPGQRTAYQPDRHLPLNSSAEFQAGSIVAIRIPGASYHGTILTRAAVERSEKPE